MGQPSKRWWVATNTILGLAVIAAGAFGWWLFSGFQARHEWGVLTTVEFKHQSLPFSTMEFVEYGQRHLVCVRGITGKRVWIMLDPKYAPFYKQRPPDESFELADPDFVRILQSTPVDDTVKQCLRSHVTGQSE